MIGLAVIREREVGAERERVACSSQPAQRRLGVAHLFQREGRHELVWTSRLDLRGRDFEQRSFCGGFFLGFEVTADADAVEVALHAEREHAIPVLKPADGERIFMFHG